jgi:hypothetical protein
MKKINNYTSLCAFLLLVFSMANANAQNTNKPDFSGTWTVNYDQSNLGDIPHYAISNQIQYSVSNDYIELKLTMNTPNGADTSDYKKLSLNQSTIDNSEPDKRKRTYTLNFSNNKLVITTVANAPGDPSTVQYQIAEEWTLSADGKTLSIDKTVSTPADGLQYHVVAVYHKIND